MVAAADFVVHDVHDEPQLLVEAKTKASASRDWAARMRRNMFAHVSLPHVPYFLLALPDRFYLWKNAPPLDAALPDYEIDAGQALRAYVAKLQTPLSALSESSFEFLVRAWLDDLMRSHPDRARIAQPDEWLVKSGLYDAIRHGSIKTQA